MSSKRSSLKFFIAKRILQAIPLILLIVILNFVLIHMAPGDPVYILTGEFAPSAEYLSMMRTRYGLDKPLLEQLSIYMSRVIQGDLGYSLYYQQPVFDLIMQRLPVTLLLMFTQLAISAIIGIILGVIVSRKPYSLTDNVASIASLAAWSMPVFWLGQLALLLFAVYLGWFPSGGFRSIGGGDVLDILYHLFLPAVCLSLTWGFALIFRMTRSSMLEVLRENYILTARSKGLSENVVIFKHALRNALLPVITVIGMQMGTMFAGAVMTETVFSWPGIGRLTYESILRRDYPVLMGTFLFASVFVIAANLITDIFYAFIDPRIRYR